jgi:hypothetical protein
MTSSRSTRYTAQSLAELYDMASLGTLFSFLQQGHLARTVIASWLLHG